MQHNYKNFEMEIAENGTVSGYFSTYDRVPDAYNQVVAPGAFDGTIKRRAESGHPYPLCWNHDLDQIIGAVYPEDIKETDKGPYMEKAIFFDTPLAQEKRELVKSGVVFQFSFAYDVIKAGTTTIDGKKYEELQELELFEVSIVPIPANQLAVVTDVKASEPKSLESLTKADADLLNEAIGLLEELREKLDDEEEELLEVNEPSEEPKAVNSELIKALLDKINELRDEE